MFFFMISQICEAFKEKYLQGSKGLHRFLHKTGAWGWDLWFPFGISSCFWDSLQFLKQLTRQLGSAIEIIQIPDSWTHRTTFTLLTLTNLLLLLNTLILIRWERPVSTSRFVAGRGGAPYLVLEMLCTCFVTWQHINQSTNCAAIITAREIEMGHPFFSPHA